MVGEEFSSCLGIIQNWGVNVRDPRAAFADMDENSGGMVLFNEFAQWALEQGTLCF